MVDFVLKILIKLTNQIKLLSFAPTLLATGSKCASEDSKKMKKIVSLKNKICQKTSKTYAKKNHQNRNKNNNLLGGLRHLKPPVHGVLRTPHPHQGLCPQAPDAFGLNILANWLAGITG